MYPSFNNESIRPTGTRVPTITGIPLNMVGSEVMYVLIGAFESSKQAVKSQIHMRLFLVALLGIQVNFAIASTFFYCLNNIGLPSQLRRGIVPLGIRYSLPQKPMPSVPVVIHGSFHSLIRRFSRWLVFGSGILKRCIGKAAGDWKYASIVKGGGIEPFPSY